MKHHIVIKRGDYTVENMMSSISSPKELRARLVKKYPGKRAIYFRIIDDHHGSFSNGHGKYHWFIDSCDEKRPERPARIPAKEIVRSERIPYGCIAKDDVIEFPRFKAYECVQQQVRPDSPAKRYLMKGICNGKPTFIDLRDLHYLVGYDNTSCLRDVMKKVYGKKFHITRAYRHAIIPFPRERALLTGKPLSWFMRPVDYLPKVFEYEEL